MEPIYPLISTSASGPLGVVHLPRLWLKVLLHAEGRLPEGYRHGAGGFDEMTLTALGIEPAAFVAFIEKERPNYLQCEAWVKANAKHLDAQTIRKHNESLLGWQQKEELAAKRRAYVGIDDPSMASAVMLNQLDDWMCVFGQVTGKAVPSPS